MLKSTFSGLQHCRYDTGLASSV